MPTVTLFEHQARAYADLGWGPEHPALAALEQLNRAAGFELVQLGRRQLRATQYVGVLRLGDHTLQVLPKIDHDPLGDPEASPDSRPYAAAVTSATGNLLHLLSYTHDLEIREQAIAPLLARRADWLELLTRLLAQELCRQMQVGIERAYVPVQETLPTIRGRWQLGRQLTSRPHLKHRFDVLYDEFSEDTALNQLFAFVVRRLLPLTTEVTSRHLLAEVAGWLGEVTVPAEIGTAHCDRVCFSRLNERFRPAFNLARLFVERGIYQLSAGRCQHMAFVFDMNRLFEEFVGRFVLRHRQRLLPERWRGATVALQGPSRPTYLAELLPGHRSLFRLIPDLLITGPAGERLLILDTKYKRLDAAARQGGIAEGDLYQMIAYASRLDCRNVLLLYPEWPGSPTVPLEMEVLGCGVRVVVGTLNIRCPLDRPDGVIRNLRALFQLAAAPVIKEVN